MLRIIGVVVLLSSAMGLAQSASAPAPAMPAAAFAPGTESPRFEVVSIKPGKAGCGGMSVSVAPNRFQAQCITVWGVMFNAYNIKPSERPPGLPAWADSVPFDIEAKMDDGVAAALQKLPAEERNKQSQSMLQALLADHFNSAYTPRFGRRKSTHLSLQRVDRS